MAAIAIVFAAALAAESMTAGDKPRPSVGGTVLGLKGKPEVGVEVQAKRLDAKMPLIIATTDRKGEYAFANLPVGQYFLTAYLDGAPRSQALIRTQSKGWVKVNFDLQLEAAEPIDRMQKELRGFLVIPNQNQH